MKIKQGILSSPGTTLLAGAPEGFDAAVLGALVAECPAGLVFVARDDVRLNRMDDSLAFFAPDVERVLFPSWDCLPYDRVSPNGDLLSRRIHTLARLAETPPSAPRILLTTVSAAVQRVPPRHILSASALVITRGERRDPEGLTGFLGTNGYARAETVLEPGEYAVRGGIVDIFPSGRDEPVRIDFFGDEVEAIRVFEPASQRTTGEIDALTLRPVSEVVLTPKTISRFRSEYRSLFGAVDGDDPLYAAVSEGRRYGGIEHWLPLFYAGLETLFDYVPRAAIVLDDQADEAFDVRMEMVADHYEARQTSRTTGVHALAAPYKPVPPETLYFTRQQWTETLAARPVARLSPFAAPEETNGVCDVGGRPGQDFAAARAQPDVNVFDALVERIDAHRRKRRRIVVAAVSRGSRERLRTMMGEHGITQGRDVANAAEISSLGQKSVGLAVINLERGFTAPEFAVITEEDLLGDRLVRRAAKRIRPENFLKEASALAAGDLVVHVDHGIGRYQGLETISVGGAPHDCLRIHYAADDKLFLPVENIEVISRYGTDQENVALDRLGGAGWQSRKAKLKARIRDMAAELIKVAAARVLKPAAVIEAPGGLFEEFCARFPYAETEDQERAITDVVDDLSRGQPTDRLICGDVGFGKTEVALRAAFLAAMEGKQVAIVVPTTLLCRQHVRTFQSRFAGYPIRIAELSRLIPAKEVREVKKGLAGGRIDIIVATHAILANDVKFRDLGLLIVDEEQHFGVRHKEKLKALKSDVHVLTLTATPIPRTLQLALTGVKEMSLIATPPLDRLAVRTFVLEFDPVVIREAILREHLRGGQTFYVCPRIEDMPEVTKILAELVPEVRMITAHGRLAARDLEAAVGAFYEGAYDVLLSTNIIESGLDLPSVNTIVVHRADMFGLAQLYQLRGRVGRGKTRAYAYLTLPPRKKLTPSAQKRLQVMQALDSLGAGFSLASHDMDIRGAGNLLGEEQSGHIREVGIELYQQMLEEAVAEARGGEEGASASNGEWSPQITLGISVLIPETYVPDLGVRLGLYRRLADVRGAADLDAFAAELIDRFGPLPDEAENLLATVAIKLLCRTANVERVDAGPKGAVVGFRGNAFPNPAGLVSFISGEGHGIKLRPDHRLVYRRNWETGGDRLAGVRRLMERLAQVALGDGAERASRGHKPSGGKSPVSKK